MEPVYGVAPEDRSPSQDLVYISQLFDMNKIVLANGNLTYLIKAAGGLLPLVLYLVKASKSGYYDPFIVDKNKTHWYKIGDQIRVFGFLAVWTTALITQILAYFGLAIQINLLVWNFGVVWLGSSITLTSFLLYFIAYEDAYSL